MKYIPLRIKTSYSILSSLNDIKKLIQFCKANDIKRIAITDNNMFGIMEFYKECIKNDIKPIIGLEIKIEDNIVLLYAKNYEGYQNLTRIVFVMQNEKINIDTLKKYRSNLICVTTMYDDLKNIYEDIYYGYTNINMKDDSKKCVYINEILCLKKEDIKYLKYLYMIKNNKKISDNIEYNIPNNCYFDFLDYDYENSLEISNNCNLEFKFNKNLMPKYDVENSKEYLFNLCKKGLYKRFDGKVTKSYYDRLLYELNVIDKMGFNDYFLVVWDYVKYSKKNNILVGPGRGSAAGSLVAYSLGITDVDPIKYNLLFERFLNIERITMPDIDIDFDSSKREDVVNYVINKYGVKRVLPIITFSSLTSKQVIRDVARIFGIENEILDKITKYIDPNSLLKESLNNVELVKFINTNNLKNIFDISLKLEGLKRQISVHAAGVIISGENLESYIPLQKYNNYYISGYSMEHLEELGLIKMDFLALKNLTMIQNLLDEIGNINFRDIDINDSSVLKLFQSGETSGIFQFESNGMKQFLTKLKPTSFDDIVSAIALYRPGPSLNIDSFIRRKNNIEKIDYFDESLIDILKPTYGIIIYQEQIMQIANVMAGYSYGEADVLRRAMSKKKRDVIEDNKEKFINQSVGKGYSKEVAQKVFNYILKFADYGFNKAHSVSYSIIAVKMAYLKIKYKEIFMSSLLTNAIGNENKTKEYVDECKKMGINILKPNINLSNYQYKNENGSIRFSLASIKNVGSIVTKQIINERKNGLYNDITDFIKRTYGKFINKNVLTSLIDADSFSEFGYNIKTLHNNLDILINYSMLIKDIDESLVDKPIIIKEEEYNNFELAKIEKDIFGFYISNHPVTKYKLNNNNIVNTCDINKYFDKKINIVVIIKKINNIYTKNDKEMAFLNGFDEYGNVDIVVFSDKIEKINDIKINDVVLINGKVEKRMSKFQVVLENIKKYDII